MGLEKAKSLLPVTQGFTFLDLSLGFSSVRGGFFAKDREAGGGHAKGV